MPTYQYACTACGHQLEAVQSFSDEPLSVCPACEGKLRKVFNSVCIVFKGSGFYRTDSRAGAKDAAGGTAPAVPGQKSDSKSESKSDSGAKDSGSKDAKPATSTPAPAAATPAPSTAKA